MASTALHPCRHQWGLKLTRQRRWDDSPPSVNHGSSRRPRPSRTTSRPPSLSLPRHPATVAPSGRQPRSHAGEGPSAQPPHTTRPSAAHTEASGQAQPPHTTRPAAAHSDASRPGQPAETEGPSEEQRGTHPEGGGGRPPAGYPGNRRTPASREPRLPPARRNPREDMRNRILGGLFFGIPSDRAADANVERGRVVVPRDRQRARARSEAHPRTGHSRYGYAQERVPRTGQPRSAPTSPTRTSAAHTGHAAHSRETRNTNVVNGHATQVAEPVVEIQAGGRVGGTHTRMEHFPPRYPQARADELVSAHPLSPFAVEGPGTGLQNLSSSRVQARGRGGRVNFASRG